ncbi:MAG: LCP family protein [Aldersonia sp.]|nr:LCP family protein [Aldersonia sp.]
MGEDKHSRPPGPDGPAPWERYFTESTEPDDARTSKPAAKRAPRIRPTRAWRRLLPARFASGRSDRAQGMSVAELVEKVADGSSINARANGPVATVPAEDEAADAAAETVQLPRYEATRPPPATAVPKFVGNPDAVGAPKLTRLALNRERRRRRVRAIGRITTAILAAMALLATGVVWGYLRSTDNGFAQVAALDQESSDIVDPVGQTGDETYLIVGTDTRVGANAEIGAGTIDDAAGARSDTVMLVNIPADRSRVVAVSFPRDLDVSRPECEGWDNATGAYTPEIFPAVDNEKLNGTYALGGPKCLVKVIQKISGLKIGHFVAMDFSGFEAMVNQVGGVQVCSPTPLFDDELGMVLPNPGEQTIDGKTALNYVRARNVGAEGNGDYGRIKRQQLFLSSLLRSALSNKVLFDPGKLNGFVNAFTRDTFVQNVTTRDLLMLGRSLRNVEAGAVTFLTVPTGGTTWWGNEIPRTQDIQAIFDAIINDDPLPGEERAEPTSSTDATTPEKPPQPIAVEPGSVTLQVSNASDVGGAAANAANALAAYGFQIYNVGNHNGTSPTTTVRYSSGHEADAATVASAVPGATTQEIPGLGSIVELVLGTDYTGATTAPVAAGSPLPATATAPTGTGSDAPAPLPPDLSFTNAADDPCP